MLCNSDEIVENVDVFRGGYSIQLGLINRGISTVYQRAGTVIDWTS